MDGAERLDRRALLRLALLSGGLAGLAGGRDAGAAPDGIDPRLRRGYTPTRYGQVHHWSIGQGPAIVAVHQSAQTSAEYVRMAPYLADRFRVVAIDLPGHGQSDTPDAEPTVDDYADAIIAVLDDLGIPRVHGLGQHGGAAVVVNLALRYPERTARLILSGAGRSEHIDMDEVMNTPMTRDLPVDVDGDFLARTWAVYRRMSAPDTPPEITLQPFVTALLQRQRRYDMHYAVYRWDFLPLLRSLDKPVMLFEGEADIYAGDVRALQRRIRGSQYRTVPGGSWQFYEKPAENAAAVAEFFI